MKKYIRKPDSFVTAVQIDLDLVDDSFQYKKWGDTQTAKSKDWLVNNDGEVYTVDYDSFSSTYKETQVKGQFVKVSCVFAQEAPFDGAIETKEGTSHYKKGDFIVYNNSDGTDGYTINHQRFLELYQEA